MDTLAQQAYHTWIASLYGSTAEAFTKGVKTWEMLPDKAQTAWEVVVDSLVQGIRDALIKGTHETTSGEGCGDDSQ